METHVQTPIEPHHFTPFATLLFQLPTAVTEAFGSKATLMYEYFPIHGLVVTIRPNLGRIDKVEVIFKNTAYSYQTLYEMLDDASQGIKL